MKTNKTIRSMVAMMVIFFAVSTTSCKKEENITPNQPTVPTTPVVSLKPSSIITSENGSDIRKQIYTYDVNGKLKSYITISSNGEDSVLVLTNSVAFKRQGSTSVSQVLSFNTDKTYKAIFSATDQTDFVNNQSQLSRITKARPNNTPLTVGEFAYTNNNLSTIGSEIRIDINYHDNLPYQKGINEIPVALKPIFNYKVMEQENATSTVLYNKLIKQVLTTFSNTRSEKHDYTYVFDANNRVIKITDTITNINSNTITQRIVISTINY